jgi:hypothetical protein
MLALVASFQTLVVTHVPRLQSYATQREAATRLVHLIDVVYDAWAVAARQMHATGSERMPPTVQLVLAADAAPDQLFDFPVAATTARMGTHQVR